MSQSHQQMYSDFIEENYRRLLRLAKQRYSFIRYPDYAKEGTNILWRHDVDYSILRSLALAAIEHEEGVNSTFLSILTVPTTTFLSWRGTKG